VAVIVNSMQALHEAEQAEQRRAEREIGHEETASLADEIRALRQEVQGLKALLKD